MGGLVSTCKRMAGRILASGAALCLSACDTLSAGLTPGVEPRLALAGETRLQARVLALAAPVLTANAAACPHTHPFTGLVTTHIADWPGSERGALQAAMGADPRPRIWITAPDSPATRAGLQPGDILLGLNGRWSQSNARWHDDFRARTFPAALRRGPARLRVERSGESLDLVLTPQPACAAHVRLVAVNIAGGRRQSVWIAGDSLFVARDFAVSASDITLQQFMALALARHIARSQSLPAVLARALQGPDLLSFTLGFDAIDQLAGRGPDNRPPRQRRPSDTDILLTTLLLMQAEAYAPLSGPASPASAAASGPEGVSDTGSGLSVQP